MAHIKRQLARGELKPGCKVASVRDLAMEYGVNPNTMQKALSELERAGYLYSERTSGRCVTSDTTVLEKLKQEEPEIVMSNFYQQMTALGIPAENLPAMLEDFLKRKKDNPDVIS